MNNIIVNSALTKVLQNLNNLLKLKPDDLVLQHELENFKETIKNIQEDIFYCNIRMQKEIPNLSKEDLKILYPLLVQDSISLLNIENLKIFEDDKIECFIKDINVCSIKLYQLVSIPSKIKCARVMSLNGNIEKELKEKYPKGYKVTLEKIIIY
jgi:hypothetical protein